MDHNKRSRMTMQRRIILEELRESRCHPTADEVFQRVRLRMPRISLGTVYRNLDMLAGQGRIRKLDIAGSQRRFDVNPEPHCHVRCVKCGSLEDVQLHQSFSVDQIVREAAGYEICDLRLELLGLCPRCQIGKGEASHQKPQDL